MVQEFVSGVVVGGAVGDESVYLKFRMQLPELGERNNGRNTIVPTCGGKPQVQRQVCFDGFVVGRNKVTGIAIEPAFFGTIPAPRGIGV